MNEMNVNRPVSNCLDPQVGVLLSGYELGTLSSEDGARFEEHIEDCTSCLDELYEMSPYSTTLRGDAAAVLENWSARSRGRRLQEVPGRWTRLREWVLGRPEASPWRNWVAVAAPIALAGVVFLGWQKTQPSPWQTLALVEPLAYVSIQTRNDSSNEIARLKAAGMTHYVQGEYLQAARLLEEAITRRVESPARDSAELDEMRLYTGISRLLSNSPDEAEPLLEFVRQSSNSILVERATWYLAQAALLSDDPESASSFLEALVGSPIYDKPATLLLEDIRSR